jgi:hypothetical protein
MMLTRLNNFNVLFNDAILLHEISRQDGVFEDRSSRGSREGRAEMHEGGATAASAL